MHASTGQVFLCTVSNQKDVFLCTVNKDVMRDDNSLVL